eukprot:scaffold1.g5611.t1
MGALAYRETGWLQEGHKAPVYAAAFNHLSPHLGDLLATVGANRATVYQCYPGGEMEVVQAFVDVSPEEEYYACAWSVDARTGAPLLLVGGRNGLLQVINCATGVLETTLEGHGKDLHDIAVHPTRPQLVATASKDQSLRLWNLGTRVCVLVMAGEGGHHNDVLSVDWKPSGDGSGMVLVSAGMDSYIKARGRGTRGGERWSLMQEGIAQEQSSGSPAQALRGAPRIGRTRCIWDLERYGETIAASMAWRPCGRAFPTRHVGRPSFSTQELQLEGCKSVWWVRFSLNYWCSVLAVGTSTGRVLVFDPRAQRPAPAARLVPRRAAGAGKQERVAPLVRQAAVSYDGGVIVSCHDDGSLTRYDRIDKAAGATDSSDALGSSWQQRGSSTDSDGDEDG